MRRTARGLPALLALLASVGLTLFLLAGSTPAEAGLPAGTGSTADSTATSAIPADAAIVADTSGGGRDSWRAAIRVPRAAQPFGPAGLAVLPAVTLAAGLVLLLVMGRSTARPATSTVRRHRTVRGPPGSIDR